LTKYPRHATKSWMKNPVGLGVGALRRAVDVLDRLSMRAQLSDVTLDVRPSAKLSAWRISAKPSCTLTVGEHSMVSGSISFERPHSQVTIGDRTFMNGHLIAAERITVGDDVLMAWGVTVVDHDSHSQSFSKRAQDVLMWSRGEKDWTNVTIRPVTIGNKSWIGFDASILKGITIGEGAVVAACSVVTKDVAPWTVVAGNPARVIRAIPENER
jgi:acetyltransferase-like isoleucine patch superfamily enzyme